MPAAPCGQVAPHWQPVSLSGLAGTMECCHTQTCASATTMRFFVGQDGLHGFEPMCITRVRIYTWIAEQRQQASCVPRTATTPSGESAVSQPHPHPPVPDLGKVSLHLLHAPRRDGLQDLRHLRRHAHSCFTPIADTVRLCVPAAIMAGRLVLIHDSSKQLGTACNAASLPASHPALGAVVSSVSHGRGDRIITACAPCRRPAPRCARRRPRSRPRWRISRPHRP